MDLFRNLYLRTSVTREDLRKMARLHSYMNLRIAGWSMMQHVLVMEGRHMAQENFISNPLDPNGTFESLTSWRA